jgi:nuclear pore complex protein Nup98-Nup96
MNEKEVEFHDSFKPGWDACGTLVYASNAEGTSRPASRKGDRDGLLVTQKNGVVSEQREVKFAKLSSETHPNALKRQKALTTITTREGIPEAHLSTTFKFDDFFDDGNAHDQATAHEKLVWELAGVLFDDIEVPDDMKDVDGALTLLRKEKLSAFWEKLVSQATAEHVAMTKSSEEKAIASLSGHRIADACGHLLHGKDYHQATLVALIGGDETMKKDMKEQLSNWKKSSVLSEFNQPIRAIYELLAGNVCVCDGSKTGPLEDRIESFILSKRFGLDWRQAFGLRLWYATQFSDDIAEAINLFAEDLEQDKETTRPLAWYVEQGIPPLWDDPSRSEREDLLWGLLKLYANPKADLESILRPENAQLSPLDVRLSWQLSNALIAHDKASYGPNTKEADDKADALTFAFAAQLTTSGRWLDALFVLLHLSSDSARAKSAREHIARHAHLIGTPDSTAFNTLKEELKIPEQWIWECKALHQRACAVGAGAIGGDSGDSRVEVMCLLKAELYAEAHRVLAANVAPTCVIERDYDSLRTLLAGFRGKEGGIGEWTLGGEVYSDFLLLQEAMRKVGTSAGSSGGSRGSSSRGGWGEKVDDKVVAVVERLAAALPAMVDEGRRPEPGFLEEVAAQEMAKGVARVLVVMGERSQVCLCAPLLLTVLRLWLTLVMQNKDMARVLRLPLTVDTRLRYTVELGLGYYKAVMAGGR